MYVLEVFIRRKLMHVFTNENNKENLSILILQSVTKALPKIVDVILKLNNSSTGRIICIFKGSCEDNCTENSH